MNTQKLNMLAEIERLSLALRQSQLVIAQIQDLALAASPADAGAELATIEAMADMLSTHIAAADPDGRCRSLACEVV